MIISNEQMQGVLEHLKFHPDDFTSYWVMGDLLEEDNQIEWAVTFRWLAHNKKRPSVISTEGGAHYRWDLERKWPNNDAHNLRILMSSPNAVSKVFASFLDAIVWVHKRLKIWRKKFMIPGDVGYGNQ